MAINLGTEQDGFEEMFNDINSSKAVMKDGKLQKKNRPVTFNSNNVHLDKAAEHFKAFLQALGFDPDNDPHMVGTPARVVKLYRNELFRGLYEDAPRITQFDADEEFYDAMIYSGRISIRSTCSHHFLPIVGEAYIGILLNEDSPLPGLSKYARIAHHYASMPQVQERMTQQIANHLNDTLKPKGVGVLIRAKHFCQCHRGVHEPNAMMATDALRGVFKTVPAVRAEFMQNIAFDLMAGGR